MGKAISMLSRKAQRFNIENRAQKIISQEKPTPAPRHEKSKKELEFLSQDRPNFLEQHNKKDLKLDEYLKDVYVTSKDPEIVEKSPQNDPDRPLPQRRQSLAEPEWGVVEPEKVRLGSCTLRQAIEFMSKHGLEPSKYTAADIAAEYQLDVDTVANVLKYYKVMKLYTPLAEKHKAIRQKTWKELEEE